jgi:hypothetical protein
LHSLVSGMPIASIIAMGICLSVGTSHLGVRFDAWPPPKCTSADAPIKIVAGAILA